MKVKKVAAALLAALLLTSLLGMTALAQGASTNPTVEEAYELAILKTLKIDNDVATYSKMSFDFEFEQLTTKEEIEAVINASDGAFDIEPQDGLAMIDYIGTDNKPLDKLTISYERNDDQTSGFVSAFGEDAAENTTLDGVKQKLWCVRKKATLKQSGIDLTVSYYTKPGLYIYKVRELGYVDPDTDEETHIWDKEAGKWGEGWETDFVDFGSKERVYGSEAEYIIVIPVGWKDGIVGGELEFRDDDRVILQTKNDKGEDLNIKVTRAEFINFHQPESDVKIKKVVQGKYASRIRIFDFTIRLGRNATDQSTDAYTAKVYDDIEGAENTVKREYQFTPYIDQTFQLSHNEYIIIENVPAGTEFQVRETTPDNHTLTAESTIGTEKRSMNENQFENSVFAASQSGVTELVVTNTVKDVGGSPVTGILTDNFSFVMLSVVGAAGLIIYGRLRMYSRKMK